MSPTALIIGFVAMAVFTATVLVVGIMLAAGLIPRRPQRPTVDSELEPRVLPGRVAPGAPSDDTGGGQ